LQAVNKYLDENIQVKTEKMPSIQAEKNESFFVRADRKMVKICFSEILFIESLSDYIKIHLKEKTIVTRETISNIEAKLPQNEFIRVHRSYIVSLAEIDSFTNELIEIGKKQIPISRTYKQKVLRNLEHK